MGISIALMKDDTAVVFGEDVAFGGVFRCTMVRLFVRYRDAEVTDHMVPGLG